MALEEPQQVQQRRISGRGILLVPQADTDKRRMLTLTTEVVRKPKNEYLNSAYYPSKSRYGTLVFLRQDSVVGEVAISYPMQDFDFIADISGQVLKATQCSYEGVLQSFANLGDALGLTVTNITDNIKDWGALDLLFDKVCVVCYGDTAIDLTLYQLNFDACPNQNPPPKKPRSPKPPTPPIPPGSPLQGDDAVSPPYDPLTNDDGATQPYKDDQFPEPPTEGDVCVKYTVVIKYESSFGGGTPATNTLTVVAYGKIGDVSISFDTGTSTSFFLKCQGYVSGGSATGNPNCQSFDTYLIGNNGQTFPTITVSNPRIDSITQI